MHGYLTNAARVKYPVACSGVFDYSDRIFGGIYESGELLIKITETSKNYMPDSDSELPYEGTKKMLPCTILEDREQLQRMIVEMYPELPEKKAKKGLNKKISDGQI